MKGKKKLLLITFLLMAIMMISPFATVKARATIPADGLNLNIKLIRSSGYGYQLANTKKNVWKIYNTRTNANDTIYCLKGGPGFGSEDYTLATPKTAHYTEHFNLKNPSEIPTAYKRALPDVNSKNYKALLWILDNCYVAPKNLNDKADADKNLKTLLAAAGIEEGLLTEDDIDSVQQLAVWYYTNPTGDYHVEDFDFWLNTVRNDDTSEFKSLSDDLNFENGWDRAEACQKLFDYLVGTPQEPGFNYTITNHDTTEPQVTIANTVVTTDETTDKIIIGPYKIESKTSNTYTLSGGFTDKNGTPISVTYLNEAKTPIEVTNLKDIVGQTFYISVPKTTNVERVTFSISGTEFVTHTTYWSVEGPGATDQPVVVVEKDTKPIADSTTFIKLPEGEFDLSLRKFITSINGIEPTKDRTPQISNADLGSLANDESVTTANKTHPKNALEVKTNDIVIYKIRVYNEGGIAGYATQVTDYLPTGLAFLPDHEINKKYGWSNPSKDEKTIVTSYLQDKSIDAFNGTTLDYEDLEIACQVIAKVGEQDKSLKNIAEITAHKDKNGNTTVIDRDSQPGNVTTDPDRYSPKNPTKGMGEQDDDDFEELVLLGKYFDLALRKFIISINGVAPEKDRTPQISNAEITNFANNRNITTANKLHPKNALPVETGNIVIYKIRIYNEGEIDGTATQVTDYLPAGLAFLPKHEINKKYGWSNPSGDGKTIVTSYLQNKMIDAFNGTTLDFEDLEIACQVTAKVGQDSQSMKNIAEITAHKDKEGNTNVIDRDSRPGNVTTDPDKYTPKAPTSGIGEQDDDDFEELVLLGKYFDLSLRKFITEVSDGENSKKYDRAPDVIVTKLASGEATTATYNHPKNPIGVSNGNIVTYTIRVYNEGQLNGYVTEITDHLPAQLEFIVDDELNAKYGWSISSDGRTVKTNITSPKTTYYANRDEIYKNRTTTKDKVLLKAFNGTTLDYIDVQIRCKVKDNINLFEKITNIADITDFTDSEGNKIKDRDSQENNVKLPADENLPQYKDKEIDRGDKYIEGQQDDDDFEKLVLQRFDLALRKFITGVNEKQITNRAPVFTKENGKYQYVHPKDPVEVANGNIVTYTLRIFNEGNIAGYASEIKDNLPQGIEFLPEHETNKTYRWKMYKEDGTETTDVKEAYSIKTDYLSKEQEKEKNANLLKAFNPETMTMPDYKDVKIAFKVTEPNTSDRIIINTAEITDDTDEEGKPVEDVDSTPDNNKEGEDDIDIEKIKVKYFDLSLKKWVTEAIVTYNGKTTVTKTGHTGDENPEPPVKVELRTKNISKTTVKFKFKIKVTNEGEIAGYAKELIDYIPEGLKFVQADNKNWREEDGKVLTNQLKDTLLQPGESASVEIILTWINNKNNMGLKTNWAEIYKDYNEYNSPDIDSTPGNNVKGEDDIDEAPVILSASTGSAPSYITLALASISMLTCGIALIKKFVL